MWRAALFLVIASPHAPAQRTIDESPGEAGTWGWRPRVGATSRRNPPSFSWRPQPGALVYELQIARHEDFRTCAYQARAIAFNVHCPTRVLAPGAWNWRMRFRARDGKLSRWSRPRSFTIAADAATFVLPARAELLARIPEQHPRLFVRPEDLPALRARLQGELRGPYQALLSSCRRLLENPPPSQEPSKYSPGMVRGSDPWRERWWGNRRATIRLLEGAATLAFTWRLSGEESFGRLARRLLLAAARWDPHGASGYRYNDEAGMPYAYHFSRTYTFIQPLLSEAERDLCRRVMSERGAAIYRHLCPRHFWRPYASHSNRAWHFLGEVAIAFHGEIPAADDWLWFAVNVFANVYPVWSDDQGGWHEGSNYWRSYLGRFTWWADVMRTALRLDAYRLPYFSQAGYYPLYLMPPGTRGGGFGDLTARSTSASNRDLMAILAAQGANPHWQWYVERLGGARITPGYIGLLRETLATAKPRAPRDLPSSRCFFGTGQAVLNSNLLDASDNVEVIFKSSPFGTQSHGYESQNSFLLYAFGERLLIRSGRRDSYGSKHHREWMWQSKSTNCITVDGRGQRAHSATAAGRISAFHTSELIDYVRGEAAAAHDDLERFSRGILFLKPDLIVIHDRLRARRPARFTWWLHAPTPMRIGGQNDLRITAGAAACRVSMLVPTGLELSYSDAYDPPPRPRVKLVEYHLRARTPAASKEVTFVTVLRPHRAGHAPLPIPSIEKLPGGYILRAPCGAGSAAILLRARSDAELAAAGLRARGELAVRLLDASGEVLARYDDPPATSRGQR